MPLLSSSLQTPATDFGVTVILDGQVLSMDVLDPTENNEKTSLLETDDEFDVVLSWQLTGAATPVVGGYWIVNLYSDDMDGVGQMTGPVGGTGVIPIVPSPNPTFTWTFKVSPPVPKVGVYKLTATINHSTDGNPNHLTEMFGFAEATPIQITDPEIELN